jgi:regulator of protease activity HflC (stomatin/prohibitin superfamily)
MKLKFGLLALISILSVGCTRINPGHVGIKVTAGGSDRGVSDFPAQVGWVFYNPFVTSVYEYPTYVQTAVWTKNPNEGNANNEEITFTNKDQMTVMVDVNLSYHLLPEKVPSFYVKFRSDDLNSFTHGYLRNVTRDTFNMHAGTYGIADIMGDNAQFIKDVRKSLQDEVEHFGVIIDQFGVIGAPRPPGAVIEAINAKVHATQLAQQKQNELVQVQAEMAKEREKADTYARNGLVTAEAAAKANKMLTESISPNLLELKRLEKWDGHLPQFNGGSTNPFVSIERK